MHKIGMVPQTPAGVCFYESGQERLKGSWLLLKCFIRFKFICTPVWPLWTLSLEEEGVRGLPSPDLLRPHVWPLLPAHPRVVLILKIVKKLFSKQAVFVVHSKRFYKQNQICFSKEKA